MDNNPIINERGTKRWRLNGKYHRIDGPAIEFEDGGKEWYLNGERHRVDGPAVEDVDGHKEWWLNGDLYYFDEWLTANTYISEEEKLMLKLIHG
jgi:hypothetical protein